MYFFLREDKQQLYNQLEGMKGFGFCLEAPSIANEACGSPAERSHCKIHSSVFKSKNRCLERGEHKKKCPAS